MKQCWCGCSLRKGSKVISVFHLVRLIIFPGYWSCLFKFFFLLHFIFSFYNSSSTQPLHFFEVTNSARSTLSVFMSDASFAISLVASFITARFLCILLGEYDGVKAFSYISNTLVAFILASFSALLIYAVYHNHRQLMMPWLFATILIACTRDIYMLIRSFFFASTGTWFGILYVGAMVIQMSTYVHIPEMFADYQDLCFSYALQLQECIFGGSFTVFITNSKTRKMKKGKTTGLSKPRLIALLLMFEQIYDMKLFSQCFLFFCLSTNNSGSSVSLYLVQQVTLCFQ